MRSIRPLIPGSEVVGFGFNITGEYSLKSMTSAIFQTNNDVSEEPFSVPGGETYDVPTNVVPVSDSKSDTQSCVTTSKSDFLSTFATSVDAEVSAGAFSGEFDYAFSETKDQSSSYYYCWCYNYYRSYSLTLRSPDATQLDPTFAKALGALPETYNDATAADYFDFLNQYGTHYITQVVCGGSMRYYVAAKSSASTDTQSTSLKVALEYKTVFVDASADAGTDWTTLGQTWASSRTVKLRSQGGDDSLGAIAQPGFNDNYSKEFRRWKDSMEKNPDITNFKLVRLSSVCGDQADNVENAIEDYLNGVIYVNLAFHSATYAFPSSSTCLIKIQNNVISPNPAVQPPPPTADQHAPSGIQVVIIDADSLHTIVSKIYYLTDPNNITGVNIYDTIKKDVDAASLPDNYICVFAAFAISCVGNYPHGTYPSPEIMAWLSTCGAEMKEWKQEIDSTSSGNLTNYIMIGVHGAGTAPALECFNQSSDTLTTELSMLLFANA